jgi:hypothetical protein
MKHPVFRLIGLLLAILLLLACAPVTAPAGGGAAGEPAAEPMATTVTAVKVDAASLDGAASYWADAPVLTVHTVAAIEGEPDGPDVSIQAVYDDANIAMRFEWADETENIKKHVWTWDGNAFAQSGEEDRLQLMWSIENNPEFASKGCAVACHNMDADPATWWMGSESEALHYDVMQSPWVRKSRLTPVRWRTALLCLVTCLRQPLGHAGTSPPTAYGRTASGWSSSCVRWTPATTTT